MQGLYFYEYMVRGLGADISVSCLYSVLLFNRASVYRLHLPS